MPLSETTMNDNVSSCKMIILVSHIQLIFVRVRDITTPVRYWLTMQTNMCWGSQNIRKCGNVFSKIHFNFNILKKKTSYEKLDYKQNSSFSLGCYEQTKCSVSATKY